MVVVTGRSSTHVKALAKKLVEACKKANIKNIKEEGKQQGDWLLVDVGDVIVHIFRQEVRNFYEIDKLWQDALLEDETIVKLERVSV